MEDKFRIWFCFFGPAGVLFVAFVVSPVFVFFVAFAPCSAFMVLRRVCRLQFVWLLRFVRSCDLFCFSLLWPSLILILPCLCYVYECFVADCILLFVLFSVRFWRTRSLGCPPLPSDNLMLGIDARLLSPPRFWEKTITTCPCRVIPVTKKGYSGDFDELRVRSSLRFQTTPSNRIVQSNYQIIFVVMLSD